MKLWKAWRLKTKLVLSFSFLFAFSIISSGIFYYYSSVGELKKQTLQLLDTNSTQITRSLELYIEDMEKLSLSVFNDSLVQRVLSHSEQTNEAEDASLNQQMTSHLLNISVSWPSVQGIYLYPFENKAVTSKAGKFIILSFWALIVMIQLLAYGFLMLGSTLLSYRFASYPNLLYFRIHSS
jgi:two-component system, sensor histidine kinase YesM